MIPDLPPSLEGIASCHPKVAAVHSNQDLIPPRSPQTCITMDDRAAFPQLAAVGVVSVEDKKHALIDLIPIVLPKL